MIRWQALSRLVLLLGASCLALPASALVVSIDHPTFLEPALGEVTVEVSVEPQQERVRVALWVDERPQAILESPPYQWIVDVGGENSEHTFRIVATDSQGLTVEASVVTPRLEATEEMDLELQQLYVTVLRNGVAAGDLPEIVFLVEDNGEPQRLVTFERGDIPLTAVVLLDVSSSMGGPELEMALSSSRSFIEGLQPLDETMLLLFSDRVVRSTDFTGFKEVLIASLSRVTATGPTALHDHLYLGLKLVERQQGRRVVLLLSDGIDSASVLTAQEVASFAEKSQALVYWLRLPAPGAKISSSWHDSDDYRQQLETLESVVLDSGGRVLELGGVAEARAAFEEVLEELRNQYVLGYYPTTRSDDGAWHTVKVEVSGPGLKVRARRGYIDF
jgi:Ca-activated chloride channel family protein